MMAIIHWVLVMEVGLVDGLLGHNDGVQIDRVLRGGPLAGLLDLRRIQMGDDSIYADFTS